MEDKLDTDLNITWKAFLLEQVNSRRGAEWKAWQDPRFTSRDMPPHEAAKSILAQHGEEAFKQYHMALFRAYHVDKRDIANPLELIAIAREQGIDTTALAEDLRTRRFKEEIGQDHDEADEKYDIFGVPTVIFNGEQPTFFKLAAGEWEETGEDDVALFNDLCGIAAPRPYVMEIKKPASAATASASAARREREGS